MALKPAVGAVEAHLRWPEDRLRETEEQRHPDQHDADGEQPPEGTRHRDVAKTRRCQRSHGEIERVEVAIDLGIAAVPQRSEEHTSELQSLMRISYAVFCLKKNTNIRK